jgi:multicomponent K+:H+ antiporter subunit C
MTLWLAFIVALLFGAGVYFLFFPQTFDFFLGFSLLTYAVNCFVFLMGGAQIKSSPILGDDVLADPLPQALVLTAIVIGLASTIYLLVFMVTLFRHSKDDLLDHHKQKAKKRWWR